MSRTPNIPGVQPSLVDHERRIQTLEAVNPGSGALDWQTLTLDNNWVAGSVPPAVARAAGGVVLLRGEATGGTWNSRFATLPTGFWPDAYTVEYGTNYATWPPIWEIDNTTGEIWIYNQAGDGLSYGYPTFNLTDEGGTISAGLYEQVTDATALFNAYGDSVAFLTSRIPGSPSAYPAPIPITGLGTGWGMPSGPSLPYNAGAGDTICIGMQPVYFIQPWQDQYARLTIGSSGDCTIATVGVRTQWFWPAGTIYGRGYFFTLDDNAGGNMYLLRKTSLNTIADVLASDTSPGFSPGDEIALSAAGPFLQAFINGTPVASMAVTETTWAQGFPAFGMDGSVANVELVSQVAFGYPPDDLWPPFFSVFLDGVSFGGA